MTNQNVVNMNLRNLIYKTVDFGIRRLAELVGLALVSMSILLFIALISYSPEDPNFIFNENIKIKNYLGVKGSFVSDIFYQTIGLISILIPFTIFFTGFYIVKNKNFLIIIENLFFVIVYSILGSLFFTAFHNETFWLTVNGNNGFVGNLFENSFLITLINLNEKISYYILASIISISFLIIVNFNIINFLKSFGRILHFFKRKENVGRGPKVL